MATHVDALVLKTSGTPPSECRRATYLLERGVWRATCVSCGSQFTDTDRRRLNQLFRTHIQDRRDLIDLTEARSSATDLNSQSPSTLAPT